MGKGKIKHKRMTETQFIQRLRKETLEPRGWLVFKINERFSSGFPDLICIRDKTVRFIEVKREFNQLTKIQKHTLQTIAQHDSEAQVIFFTEDGWEIFNMQGNGDLIRGEL